MGYGWDKVFIQVKVNPELIVFVDRIKQPRTDFQVCRQEELFGSSVERHFGTDIRDIISQAPKALAFSKVHILLHIAGHIDGYGIGSLHVLFGVGAQIGTDITQGDSHRVGIRELHPVT